MFEEIPMITIDLKKAISNSNYHTRLDKYKFFSSNMSYASNAQFFLSGKQIQTILAPPYSMHPSGDFIYLQVFAAINGDSSFYTFRKNYASYMLLYTYEGSGILEYEGETYQLNPGDGFLIDCQKEHFYKTAGDHWYHSDLHFYGGTSDLLYKEFQKNRITKFTCENTDCFQRYLIQILKNYRQLSSHTEYFIAHSISSLIQYILMEHEKKSDPIPNDYRYMMKYIENNYKHDLTVEYLSDFFGISRYHLSREFKKYTGFSPMDYIIELRINHAKLLLTNTDLPAYRIGALVGISNEANFMRLFKKRVGLTPGQFRKNIFL